MKQLMHPAGYTITIESWENDGDYSATKTMYLPTEKQARTVVKFAQLFCNSYRTSDEEEFGNLYEITGSARAKLIEIVRNIYEDDEGFKEFCEGDTSDDAVYEWIYEQLNDLGLRGLQEGQFSRVVERMSVQYHNEPVYADVIDISTW